jgi:eukaryotic-like serine/threonine-protein kinase
VTHAVYAATVRARARAPSEPPMAADPAPLPAVTLPELPLLSVGWAEGQPQASGPPGEGDADFEVAGVLGEGGMGRVLLARQRSLRRDVAIKVVKPEQASPAGIDTLLAEAVITGSVDHPGVTPVHLLGRRASPGAR